VTSTCHVSIANTHLATDNGRTTMHGHSHTTPASGIRPREPEIPCQEPPETSKTIMFMPSATSHTGIARRRFPSTHPIALHIINTRTIRSASRSRNPRPCPPTYLRYHCPGIVPLNKVSRCALRQGLPHHYHATTHNADADKSCAQAACLFVHCLICFWKANLSFKQRRVNHAVQTLATCPSPCRTLGVVACPRCIRCV
jgi:hypothetical protein